MKDLRRPGLAAASLLCLPLRLAATNVCGQYTTSQTWTTSGSPYVVTCDVVISASAAPAPVLTINAGVTVKFNAGASIVIGGSQLGGINVQGTSASHVVFTSSASNPAAGDWNSVQVTPGAVSTLSLAYLDVLYSTYGISYNVPGTGATLSNVRVQYTRYEGLRIYSGSPTISAATLSNNQWGLRVDGGAPTINGSTTISANSAGGVYVFSPAAPSLQTVTISNNTGYAINEDAAVTFGTMSGLTVQGNTYDAVGVRPTTLTTNARWKSFGVPYLLQDNSGVWGPATPVLTIDPGVTVKFCHWCNLVIGAGTTSPGGLLAVGTPAQPITFTANGSTSPGYWGGVQLNAGATSSSKVQWATVNYGTGILVQNSSPTIDHVTLNANTVGITTSSATPIISNCNFAGNNSGIVNQTTSTPVTAKFNWWNSNTGPSGSGPGSGQSVSAGVLYEPWLGGAGSSPQYLTTFLLLDGTFNPTLNINANFSFTTAQSGNWSLKVYTASNGTLVRTITGTGTSGAPAWDGKNDGGALQANGTYDYQIDSTAGSNSAAPLRGRVTLDTARQLKVANLLLTPAYFSPNADGVQDPTTLSATASFDGASWSLSIKNSGGTVVRSASGSAGPNLTYTWDGKNGSGTIQPDGVYTFALTVTDGGAPQVVNSLTATLDRTIPVATTSSPAAGATLSNIANSGSANITVTGTSTDANLSGWTLDYGPGSAPTTWTNIASGSAPVSSGTLGTWSTLTLTNGQYTLRLVSNDLAGNKTTTTKTVTVGNFNVTGGSQVLNPAGAGTVTYTSVVPFTIIETLVIKDGLGNVVKTLFNGSRNAGSYNDVWDGKNTSGQYVPAGTYSAAATAVSGPSSMTWNPPAAPVSDSTPFINYQIAWTGWDPHTFWPFNNRPLPLTYTIPTQSPSRPARTWLMFTPDYMSVYIYGVAKISWCGHTGNFCVPAGQYQGPGTYTVPWIGLDGTRTVRPDVQAIVLMVTSEGSDNGVISVTGSEPRITNLSMTPSYFRPGFGNLQISFNLTTFQTRTVTMVATIERLNFAGAVKTINLSSQSPGAITLQWDGRTDSGVQVAEGTYLVTITVTDPLGSVATQQALMTIAY